MKCHAEGYVNSPLVRLQFEEIVGQMSMYRDENPCWDFRELVNTRPICYRTFVVVCMLFLDSGVVTVVDVTYLEGLQLDHHCYSID
jgi:hypothetical protein